MTALAATPVRRIVRAIADAAERWSDADFPLRVRLQARIVERTGYTLPVVEYALDQLFFSLRADSIQAAIVGELGSLDALDGFVARANRPDGYAAPAGNVCVISSRTTIGVAIVPAVFALCAKCDVLVKDREDGFVGAFFTTLVQELGDLALAARAQNWQGDDDAVDLAAFDTVVAFGSDRTLVRIRERMAPQAHLVGFGAKASIGYIAREALATDDAGLRRIAAGAARDFLLYDTEGCLSLRLLFIERGALLPEAFSRIFAAELERASVEFPIGDRGASDAARVATARNLAAFRSAGGIGCVYSDASASYLAVLDPPAHEPPALLPRAIGIHAVDSPAAAVAYVREHRLPIEAVAIAGDRDDLAQMALDIGASRIARFGEMQTPALAGNHGGRPRIGEFVRWISRG